ncbi:MAG: CRISPR system precrRNA processing endoribonuclease RAMP protein Cas6 [Gammaproteobacteria bacterium]|nr:CRISPR system precrRNA processing endoribonuclease RAMP protein Cas6 [Gammaproteobacteria bacterium]
MTLTHRLSYLGSRYRFDCMFNNYPSLPEYPGSVLRSAFGMALRRIACVTNQSTCPGCPLINECVYTKIFDSGIVAQTTGISLTPYVIESSIVEPKTNSTDFMFGFHMVVYGIALKQLPLLVLAWQKVLACGLGKKRTTGKLVRVVCCQKGSQDVCVWREDQPRIIPHDTTTHLDIPVDKHEVVLHFDTPVRLQRKGKILGHSEITSADLISGCMRRFSAVVACSGEQIDRRSIRELTEQSKSLEDKKELKFVQYSRYSSRQRYEMQLPGLIGSWRIRGDLKPYLHFLYLCEIFHVGKNTSIGLGKYTIDPQFN